MSIWVNIERFNYLDKTKTRITKEDIYSMKKARKKVLVNSGVCFILTFAFSKYRHRMWVGLKKYFVKSKIQGNIYKLDENNLFLNNNINKNPEITVEYKDRYNSHEHDDSNKLAINSSRRLSSKRNKQILTEEISINETFKPPTYREEYLSSLNRIVPRIQKLIFLKKYSSKLTDQNKILKSGENFLLKTKLIYLPFLIILFMTLYELAITYLALYIKYQPLVDEYYSQKNK